MPAWKRAGNSPTVRWLRSSQHQQPTHDHKVPPPCEPGKETKPFPFGNGKSLARVTDPIQFRRRHSSPRDGSNVFRLPGRGADPRGLVRAVRHFYASVLIAANLNPKVIQARLGHASITETMDTYGHPLITRSNSLTPATGRGIRWMYGRADT